MGKKGIQIPDMVNRLVNDVGPALRRIPHDKIVESLGKTAECWLMGHSLIIQQSVEEADQFVGRSPESVIAECYRLFTTWQADSIRALLAGELTDPGMLDGFRPGANGALRRACGPNLVGVVASGNVLAPAIDAASFALLAKAPVLIKVPSEHPGIASTWASQLAEIDELLGKAVGIVDFSRNDTESMELFMSACDLVVVFGDDVTIQTVRNQAKPTCEVLTFPHRFSVAAVSREALGDPKRTARQVVEDIVATDRAGCLSPRAIFCERGGDHSPEEFLDAMAEALENISLTIPLRIQPDPMLLDKMAMAGAAVHRGMNGVTVFWPHSELPSQDIPGRVGVVIPVDDWTDLPKILIPAKGRLQAVGAAGPEERVRALAESLLDLGVARFCALGSMEAPAVQWPEDGRLRLVPYLRFQDIET